MTAKTQTRPGGRSARVQASVHAAVEKLQHAMPRDAVTIPAIAEEAGVTPSTIYRRWGDLRELFADVAIQRLRPDSPPADTGGARSDLEAWTDQYAEEMASGPGRKMIQDVLISQGEDGKASACCDITRAQLELLAERARGRGEAFPCVDDVLDQVVAPIIYRILYDQPLDESRWRRFIARLFEEIADKG
ncbi:TetR family transcriptional regulator [Breoghania corrubedonensis]|uniref:TetR family transcriptional regulator n=1 Tax=Breoghania corrubedonensis TaxID=665038 RepID=A0A2T5V1F5_9HYPH|nr:TetR/AcrR family transcriptional regulator [Breoghania corrubedonensis]PTW57589.1 TetR family transcriptional regulator [Breoghania corrubedonensis]